MSSGEVLFAAAAANPEPAGRARALVEAGAAFEREGNAARAAQAYYQSYQLVASAAAAEGAARAYAAAKKWPGVIGWLDAALTLSPQPADRLRLLKAKGRVLHAELHDAAGTQQVLEQVRALEASRSSAPPPPATTPQAAPRVAPPPPVATSSPASAPVAPPSASGPNDLEFVEEPQAPALELAYERRFVAPSPESAPEVPVPVQPVEAPLREDSPARGRRVPLWLLALVAVPLVGVLVMRALPTPAPPSDGCPPGSTRAQKPVGPELVSGCVAWNGAFLGLTEARSDAGVLLARRTWASGELQGDAEEFLEGGVVATGAYVKGQRSGTWVYKVQGQRLEEGPFEKGVRVGTWSRYEPRTGALLETFDPRERAADAGADGGAGVIEVSSKEDLERLYGGHRVSHWRALLSSAEVAGTGPLLRTRAVRAGLTITADGGIDP
ncbi:MAG: hypothetical protein SFW67_32165 [Myxococcaceae bacterium]|nr:hypothetical protein [Myxococcaceae bacterium]